MVVVKKAVGPIVKQESAKIVHELVKKYYPKSTKKQEQKAAISMRAKGITKAKNEEHKAVVAETKKAKGPSMEECWVNLFAGQQGTKTPKTDAQLAQDMRTAFPKGKQYTDKDVHAYRLFYNRGTLRGQTSKPKTLSVAKA